MNKIIFIIYLFIHQHAVSQNKNEMCFRTNNISVEKRNENYPFDKATKIVFASFEDKHNKLKMFENNKINKNEITGYFEGEVMKIYFDSLKNDFSKYNPDLFEKKIDLSEIQKNELTDLIYNFGNNRKDAVMTGSKCFVPRNAILFFDENNQLFEFVVICFECNNYETSAKNINLNNNCDEKLSLLKSQFEKAGITYGIKKQF